MSNHEDKIVIFVTASSQNEAYNLGKKLIEDRLAACCNIIPGIQSIYWWDGKVTEDPEILLMIKTKKEAEQKVLETIKSMHSYDLPEMISFPIQGGYPEYFDWIDSNVIIK
ncbi:MAG: divalent-cation tolerance protein CutA [bacterium]|nr:divalent-cation tolerance protein CutA [bacterium]